MLPSFRARNGLSAALETLPDLGPVSAQRLALFPIKRHSRVAQFTFPTLVQEVYLVNQTRRVKFASDRSPGKSCGAGSADNE